MMVKHNQPMPRWPGVIAVLCVTSALAATAQLGQDPTVHRTDLEYDGRVALVRLRWGANLGGFRRGNSNAWNHDLPRAECTRCTACVRATSACSKTTTRRAV
jgi:hypothetical protein